ncbi:MAG: hypothetical protein O7H41_16895 [Planctomycetota bacterium]|nr:hypothetical protein [Planctomycetota bacterium]
MKAHEGVPWERAHRLKGPGFLLVCNTSREVAESYAKALTKIDFELRRFFSKARLRRYLDTSTAVYIYKTHQEFLEREGVPPDVKSFFRPATGSIHAYHGQVGLSGDTVGALAHQLTLKWQAMVVNNFRNLPPWMSQGLAVYFGEGIVVPTGKGKAKGHQIPRDRLRHVQRAIADGSYIKVADLIRTPPARFSGLHYAHAWSVIYFMVNSSKSNQAVFNKLFTNVIDDTYAPSQFEKICRVVGGVEGFEEKWKEWISDLTVPPVGEIVENDTFRSDFCHASITRPDASWEFVLEDDLVAPEERLLFQVALRKGDALIKFLAANNPEHLEFDVAAARKEERLRESHKVHSAESVDANGYKAMAILYEEKRSEKSWSPRKMRRVYLTTVPHVIIVEGVAPSEAYDDFADDFEKVVQSLQLGVKAKDGNVRTDHPSH